MAYGGDIGVVEGKIEMMMKNGEMTIDIGGNSDDDRQ